MPLSQLWQVFGAVHEVPAAAAPARLVQLVPEGTKSPAALREGAQGSAKRSPFHLISSTQTIYKWKTMFNIF